MRSLPDLSRSAADLAIEVALYHPKVPADIQVEIEKAVDHLLRAKARLTHAGQKMEKKGTA